MFVLIYPQNSEGPEKWFWFEINPLRVMGLDNILEESAEATMWGALVIVPEVRLMERWKGL